MNKEQQSHRLVAIKAKSGSQISQRNGEEEGEEGEGGEGEGGEGAVDEKRF